MLQLPYLKTSQVMVVISTYKLRLVVRTTLRISSVRCSSICFVGISSSAECNSKRGQETKKKRISWCVFVFMFVFDFVFVCVCVCIWECECERSRERELYYEPLTHIPVSLHCVASASPHGDYHTLGCCCEWRTKLLCRSVKCEVWSRKQKRWESDKRRRKVGK